MFKDIRSKIEEARKSGSLRKPTENPETKQEAGHTMIISDPVLVSPPPVLPYRGKSATMSVVEGSNAAVLQKPPQPIPRRGTIDRFPTSPTDASIDKFPTSPTDASIDRFPSSPTGASIDRFPSSPTGASNYENQQPPPLPPRMEIDDFGEVDLVSYHTIGEDLFADVNEISYDVPNPTPPPIPARSTLPRQSAIPRRSSESSIGEVAPPIPRRSTLPHSSSASNIPPPQPTGAAAEPVILSQQPWRLPMDDPHYQPLVVFQSSSNEGINNFMGASTMPRLSEGSLPRLPEDAYDYPTPHPHPPAYPPPPYQ